MALADADKLHYAISYLRRKYAADLAGLKALADQVAAAVLTGQTKVTITSSSFEGGSSAGQLEFEAAIVGLAVEQLILELDPDAPRPPRVILPDYRFCVP